MPVDHDSLTGVIASPRQDSSSVPVKASTRAQVERALHTLPSHGWTGGWIGRRDRALLVLAEIAGLPYRHIARLTAGDVTIEDGVATISTPAGTTVLSSVENDLLCGPCALARWLHALDMTVVHQSTRVIAAVIARAAPITANSPHLCSGTLRVTEATKRLNLLPPIDHWGHAAFSATQNIPRAGAVPAVRPALRHIPGQRRSVSAGSEPVAARAAGPANRRTAPGVLGKGAEREQPTNIERALAQIDELAAGLERRTQMLLDSGSVLSD